MATQQAFFKSYTYSDDFQGSAGPSLSLEDGQNTLSLKAENHGQGALNMSDKVMKK